MLYFISHAVGAIFGGLLHRLRGGWFSNIARRYGWKWGASQRTQLMRLIWSLPTGFLLWFAMTPDTEMWYRGFLLSAFVFASMALWGHGAHMIYDIKEYRKRFDDPNFNEKGSIEFATQWWLPKLFGGMPNRTWSDNKIILFNFTGMTFIGFVRHLTVVLPFCIMAPWFAFWYVILGFLYAGWYVLGELTPRPKDYTGGEVAEFYVGFTTWLFILMWWFK